MLKKILWFLAFVSTGMGLLLISLLNTSNKSSKILLIILALLFLAGLPSQLEKVKEGESNDQNKGK